MLKYCYLVLDVHPSDSVCPFKCIDEALVFRVKHQVKRKGKLSSDEYFANLGLDLVSMERRIDIVEQHNAQQHRRRCQDAHVHSVSECLMKLFDLAFSLELGRREALYLVLHYEVA